MSDYGESYKRYKSARALASAVVNGTSFRTDGCYFLTTSTDMDDVVAILDTNAPVGPVSGRAIWRFEVQANAFLYRMVRRMVFLQVAVAQGKIPGLLVNSEGLPAAPFRQGVPFEHSRTAS